MDGVSAQGRRTWLARWWIGQAVILYFAFPAFLIAVFDGRWHDYDDVVTDDEYPFWMLGAIAVVSFLQWVYLHPVREPSASARPVNLFWSMSVGGLVVAMLVAGLLAGLLGALHDVARVAMGDGSAAAWSVIGVFLLGWIVATPLLASFVGRTAPADARMSRVAATLFAGTVVEVLAGVPFDVLARRKEDCVCARGTFWTIVLGAAGGVVMLGPLVFLVLLSRRRRRWPGGRCAACGADVGGDLHIPRCPGCGAGWAR